MFARLTLALTLVGCYAPDLADCAVTCAAETDCGGGQTCTGGRCVRDGLSCTAGVDGGVAPMPDAPVHPDAAVEPDASTEPDAPPPPSTTTLRVRVKEHGLVTPSGHAGCTDDEEECTYTVEIGASITLTAVPLGNRVFEKWEEACEGQRQLICVITPGPGPQTRVTGKFRKP